jgi:hypothetical protein
LTQTPNQLAVVKRVPRSFRPTIIFNPIILSAQMEATWVFAPQIKEISHYRRRSPFPHANDQINRELEFRLRVSILCACHAFESSKEWDFKIESKAHARTHTAGALGSISFETTTRTCKHTKKSPDAYIICSSAQSGATQKMRLALS